MGKALECPADGSEVPILAGSLKDREGRIGCPEDGSFDRYLKLVWHLAPTLAARQAVFREHCRWRVSQNDPNETLETQRVN